MKQWFLGILSLASMAVAGPPTTQPLKPQPPAIPRETPVTVDTRQPAFIPKFAKADAVPAGHFAEREHAYRYGSPGPIYSGYGYYTGGYFRGGVGTWGSTQIPFR